MKKPHKKLDAWKAALDLVLAIYRETDRFPKEELFGLTGQVRRAAISVPSTIAEGAVRQTKKEFINFLHMAQGSLSELDTQLELAKRLGYLAEENWTMLDGKAERIDKMISGLIRHLKNSRHHGQEASPHALPVESLWVERRLTPHA
ncbi:MAG: four helix bundle protein [Nitrospirota bacterium]